MESLSTPFELPCGLTLRNRLVKAALAEALAGSSPPDPNDKHTALYGAWSRGGWGAVITGNMMVDSAHCGAPGDIAIGSSKDNASAATPAHEDTLARWKQWAEASQQHGTPAFVQLNHPGRQSPRVARKGHALAPSAIPLSLGDNYLSKISRVVAFGTPVAMTQADIDHVVQQFAAGAKLAHDAGFKGIQIHAAHGYLLAQFLSPNSNTRTDGYGGSATARVRILREVVDSIRAVVPSSFCVGIKINSADHQYYSGLEDCLEQIKVIIGDGGVDYLEISGGTYEKPRMMQSDWAEANEGTESHEAGAQPKGGELKPTARTAKREAFFLDYAREVRKTYPKLALMVTGGFRSRTGMQAALDEGACDLIGLGRPGVAKPRLPSELILNDKISDEKAVVELDAVHVPWAVKTLGLKPLHAGLVSLHFQKHMKKIVEAQ